MHNYVVTEMPLCRVVFSVQVAQVSNKRCRCITPRKRSRAERYKRLRSSVFTLVPNAGPVAKAALRTGKELKSKKKKRNPRSRDVA